MEFIISFTKRLRERNKMDNKLFAEMDMRHDYFVEMNSNNVENC